MTATTEKLVAFHGKQATKTKYLKRVAKHRELDELVRGATGQNGKGCAVWCTLNKYQHVAYETELGIPQAIARLEDGLFESLPIELAMQWPERFLAAIRPGADLSLVMAKWLVWMLVDEVDGVLRFAKTARQRTVIESVAALYTRQANGEDVPIIEFRKAADAYAAAAAYAAYAAAAAADAAAYTAYAAARSQARVKQADKLIELLEAA